MLRQRVITALILVALLLPTLLTSSVVPFSLFALVLAVAGAWEWARLNGLSGYRAYGYAALVLAAAAATLMVDGLLLRSGLGWVWLSVMWVVLCCLLLPQGPQGWGRLPAGFRLVIGLVVMFSTWLALTHARGVGVNFLLSVMCLVWASDVSAYFAGHRWGRRRLAPTISPGKTWEGVAGACTGVLLLGLLWMAAERHLVLGEPSIFGRALRDFGGLGLVVVVTVLVALGVVGDLFESMIKRVVGAKDSSQLLPGHGGVLDRVDALLPVLPAAMAVLALGQR